MFCPAEAVPGSCLRSKRPGGLEQVRPVLPLQLLLQLLLVQQPVLLPLLLLQPVLTLRLEVMPQPVLMCRQVLMMQLMRMPARQSPQVLLSLRLLMQLVQVPVRLLIRLRVPPLMQQLTSRMQASGRWPSAPLLAMQY